MMFGGFLFIAGVILFAVARLKETPDEEARQKAETAAKRRQQSESIAKGLETVATSSTGVLQRFLQRRDGFYGIAWRIVVGIFVGFWIGALV